MFRVVWSCIVHVFWCYPGFAVYISPALSTLVPGLLSLPELCRHSVLASSGHPVAIWWIVSWNWPKILHNGSVLLAVSSGGSGSGGGSSNQSHTNWVHPPRAGKKGKTAFKRITKSSKATKFRYHGSLDSHGHIFTLETLLQGRQKTGRHYT